MGPPATKRARRAENRDPFIIATGQDDIKPDRNDRKFIRRQVMPGKNKGHHGKTTKRNAAMHQQEYQQQHLSGQPLPDLALAPPRPSLLAVRPYADVLIRGFLCSVRREMYPIERFVPIDTIAHDGVLQTLFRQDPLFQYIVADAAMAFLSEARLERPQAVGGASPRPVLGRAVATPHYRSARRPANILALEHMNRGIVSVRERLSSSLSREIASETTMFLVMSLAMFSEALREVEAAQQHLRGLYQLVQLRGGINSLAHNPFLQIKACRLDLIMALRSGALPLFLENGKPPYRPCIPNASQYSGDGGTHKNNTTLLHRLCKDPEPQLVSIWQDLHVFKDIIQEAHDGNSHITADLYQDSLISVQYRLHNMASASGRCRHDLTQEAIRIMLLALTTSVFLETRGGSYGLLEDQLWATLQAWRLKNEKRSTDDNVQKLALWLGYTSAVSVLDSPDDLAWLQVCLAKPAAIALHVSQDWDLTKAVLEEFLWIGPVHDVAAREFFDASSSIALSTSETASAISVP